MRYSEQNKLGLVTSRCRRAAVRSFEAMDEDLAASVASAIDDAAPLVTAPISSS